MAKSLWLTYLLWAVGGLIGLHHFYLGRDRHALVWWMFIGGYFGMGWIRDLWRIPSYVEEANCSPAYLERFTLFMRNNPKPPSGTIRYFGQMIVGDAFGYLVQSAIPLEHVPEWAHSLTFIPIPFAAALDVHLVGNIGRHKGSFWIPCIAAYLTLPLYLWNPHSVFWSSLAATVTFNTLVKEWRRTPQNNHSVAKRLFVLSICALLYLSLWGSWFYFHCNMTDKNDDTVRCKDAVKHFFKSPMWQEFLHVIPDLYNYGRHHGWGATWRHFFQALDPQGEANALKVLNLTSSVSQEEITSRYRTLSRQWHPDRHKGEEKQLAQDNFINIQQAYETLSKIKAQRLNKNKRDRDNPE